MHKSSRLSTSVTTHGSPQEARGTMTPGVVCIALVLVQLTAIARGVSLRISTKYEFSGPWNYGSPVHEVLTHLSLQDSGLTKTKFYSDKANREYLRGNIWNDDPNAQLFDDNERENWDWSMGLEWAMEFKTCNTLFADSSSNMCASLLCRSHFGDLQFLHSMANKLCEEAETVQNRILSWGEFVYKVAIEEITGEVLLRDINVMNGEKRMNIGEDLFPRLPASNVNQLFHLPNAFTCPPPDASVNKFCEDRQALQSTAAKRAAGSLAHMIQDSYAKGHTSREELAHGSNTHAGPIKSFNSYVYQDRHEHNKYDLLRGTNLPKKLTKASPSLSWIDKTPGAAEAFIQVAAMFKLLKEKASWEIAKKRLLHIFRLSSKTWPSGNGMGEQTHPICDRVELPSNLKKDTGVAASAIANDSVAVFTGTKMPTPADIFAAHKIECSHASVSPFCGCNVQDWYLRHEIVALREKIAELETLGATPEEVQIPQSALNETLSAHRNLWRDSKSSPDTWVRDNPGRDKLMVALVTAHRSENEGAKTLLSETHSNSILQAAAEAFCRPSVLTEINPLRLLRDYEETGGLGRNFKGMAGDFLNYLSDGWHDVVDQEDPRAFGGKGDPIDENQTDQTLTYALVAINNAYEQYPPPKESNMKEVGQTIIKNYDAKSLRKFGVEYVGVAIAKVLKSPDQCFLAYRGTHRPFDWFVNMNAANINVNNKNQQVRLDINHKIPRKELCEDDPENADGECVCGEPWDHVEGATIGCRSAKNLYDCFGRYHRRCAAVLANAYGLPDHKTAKSNTKLLEAFKRNHAVMDVHPGFFNHFQKTFHDAKNILSRNGCTPENTVAVGHSLGGATAMYAAAVGIAKSVITIGAPRAFFGGCPHTLEKLHRSDRFVSAQRTIKRDPQTLKLKFMQSLFQKRRLARVQYDPVPSLPTIGMGYHHCAKRTIRALETISIVDDDGQQEYESASYNLMTKNMPAFPAPKDILFSPFKLFKLHSKKHYLPFFCRSGIVDKSVLCESDAYISKHENKIIEQFLNSVKSDDVDKVQSMINQHPHMTLVTRRKKDRHFALAYAARYSEKPEMVKVLLDAPGGESMIDERTESGCTPACCAAKHGNPAILELLLNKGGNIHARSSYGESLLWWTPYYFDGDKAARLILDMPKGEQLLDAPGYHGWTPLMVAARSHRHKTVKLLLERGADPTLKDIDNHTALDLATQTGLLETAYRFIKHAFESFAETNKEKTIRLLHEAYRSRGIEIDRVEEEESNILDIARKTMGGFLTVFKK